LIPFFAGHGPFLVVVPSGDAVVAVLSTEAPGAATGVRVIELHLPDPQRPDVPAFFNWDLSYNTSSPITRSLFLSLSFYIFSFNCSMYVCVEMKFNFVYYISMM
jgi:hypothetical protein